MSAGAEYVCPECGHIMRRHADQFGCVYWVCEHCRYAE